MRSRNHSHPGHQGHILTSMHHDLGSAVQHCVILNSPDVYINNPIRSLLKRRGMCEPLRDWSIDKEWFICGGSQVKMLLWWVRKKIKFLIVNSTDQVSFLMGSIMFFNIISWISHRSVSQGDLDKSYSSQSTENHWISSNFHTQTACRFKLVTFSMQDVPQTLKLSFSNSAQTLGTTKSQNAKRTKMKFWFLQGSQIKLFNMRQ